MDTRSTKKIHFSKLSLKKFYSFSLTLILLAIILYISKDQIMRLQDVRDFSFKSLLIISLLFLFTQLTFGYQLKNILLAFNIQTNFKEWFGLIAIQSMGNYLPLSGGTVSNIAYLKIKKDLQVSDYLGYMAGDTVLKITVYGATGIVLLLINLIFFDQKSLTLLLITGMFFLLGLIFVVFPEINIYSNNRVINWIIDLHNGWLKIRSNAKVFRVCVIVHILTLIIITLQYKYIFEELNIEFDLLSIFVLTIITNLVRIASIFPGNIGFRESVSGMVLQLFGFPFGIGVIASLTGRIISMFWIFLLGGIFSYLLLTNNSIESWRSKTR